MTTVLQTYKVFILSCVLGACSIKADAQRALPDSTTRVFGLPILFFSPDTQLGGGALGIVTFAGQPFRSSISFGIAYTQQKQFLLYMPYQLFSSNQQWRAYGELGWYRYVYQYFGIGNKYPNTFVEKYTAQYPRLRISALHRMKGQHYGGLRWYFDDYRIKETTDAGEIANGTLTGANGGIASAVGGVWLFDSRDNQFFPGKGWLIEASLTGDGHLTGSSFGYARFSFDAVHYQTIGERHKLAINLSSIFSSPGGPFFSLPYLGGGRRLRGYPDGKFRDRNLILAQAEWRFPICWRFKGVVFGGGGTVFGAEGENLKIRPNGGLGLRFEFDRKQQLHLRVDYGFGVGKGNSGAYITIGEAF